MILILLSVEASQSRSTRALETGTEKRLDFLHALPQKLNQSFFLCYCAKTCSHREHGLPDGDDKLDTALVCSRDGHTELSSQSRKKLMILRHQDNCKEGVWIMLVLYLTPGLYSFIIISCVTQGPVFSLGNVEHLGPKCWFCMCQRDLFTLLYFTSRRTSSSGVIAVSWYKYNAKN